MGGEAQPHCFRDPTALKASKILGFKKLIFEKGFNLCLELKIEKS